MQNLIELLQESAYRHPKKTAVIYRNQKLSYRKLAGQTVALSQRLSVLGVQPSDKVGILLPNCTDFVTSFFAVLNLQAVVVTLNNFLRPEELKVILEDSQLTFLITQRSFYKTCKFLKREVATLKDVLFIDDDITKALPFLNRPLKDFGLHELKSRAKPDDTAVIIYTSGTTGHPKGAMLSHGNFIFEVAVCAKAIQVSRRDNIICMLPLFHSFPLTVCMLLPLSQGATTTIVEGLRPFSKVLKAIVRHQVSVFVSVPAVYNVLVHIRFTGFLRFSLVKKLLIRLRLCVSGAAALPAQTLKKFEEKFDIPLLEGYGLTETSPVVSLNPLKGTRMPGSIGLPLSGVEVKIVDEKGLRVSEGSIGELVIKGANVMKGYFNRPQETQEALKDGWLYSGDLARIDEHGFIYIVDRKKDMINVRGLKVYPREVEELLYQHPAVQEAAVVGVKDEHHGEIPQAFVVLKEKQQVSEHDLLRYLRLHIANYKVPRSIEFRDSLPKTSSGKIFKRALIG
jgi:long-chain acyl-CoA synthetase